MRATAINQTSGMPSVSPLSKVRCDGLMLERDEPETMAVRLTSCRSQNVILDAAASTAAGSDWLEC